ncbi:MAG: hypothetical protein AAFZ15_01865 [Bacteroidota bacterium]
MLRLIIAIAFFSILFSCSTKTDAPEQATPPTTQQPTAPPAETLPSVPLELLQKIFAEGTQVDYIYHYYPFTASLSEPAAIQGAVKHISETPCPAQPPCKPAGIITYQINGDIVLRADFYFESNCTMFVFYDEDKNKYGNYMTQDGVNFFNSQIQQALQLRNQAGQ